MLNRIGKKLGYKEDGFTIIEVMIVLAVAGLIMAIVLVAIPQLQRNQRDSARQNVTNRILTELGNYAGNNNGRYPFGPGELTTFTNNYLAGVDYSNPGTGNNYTLSVRTDLTLPPNNDNDLMYIYPGASCNGEVAQGTINSSARTFAIIIGLERDNIRYCIDNN